jgi:mannose-6-phosphate isomerase-like protein (cupin superfamily)
MRIVRHTDIEYRKPDTRHREPNIQFKRMLQGREGSPQNYELMLAKTDGNFFSPRHHHNFDQIRIGLTGRFGDGKRQRVGPGQVGYYPEGAHYQIDSDDAEMLLLQFGGANGDGFTHFTQLYRAYAEMARLGDFRDGVFFRHDRSNLPPGVKANQDGYEALWQHIYGRPVVYPKPRYEEPIIMDPDACAWLPDAGQAGVARRGIASFTERQIEIAQVQAEAGALLEEDAPRAPRLIFILSGRAACGEEAIEPWTAIELDRGDRLAARVDEALMAYAITMPAFSDAEIAQFTRHPIEAAA